jgi:hypothetical protein
MSLFIHFGPPIETQKDLEEHCAERLAKATLQDEDEQAKKKIATDEYEFYRDPITLDDVQVPAFKKGTQCYTASDLARWLSRQLSNDKFVNTEPTARLPFTLDERADVFRLANTVDPAGGDPQLLDNDEPVADSDSDTESDTSSDSGSDESDYEAPFTDLEQAVRTRNVEAVDWLFNNSGRTRATRLPLGRALRFATSLGLFEMVIMLQEYYGTFTPNELDAALMNSSGYDMNPDLNIFRYLVEHNIETIQREYLDIFVDYDLINETEITERRPMTARFLDYFYNSIGDGYENEDDEHQEIGLYILDKFPQVNFKRVGGRVSLYTCAENGQLQIMNVLLERYQYSPVEITSALRSAIAYGRINTARLLLQRGAHITQSDIDHAIGRLYLGPSEELTTMLREWFEAHPDALEPDPVTEE